MSKAAERNQSKSPGETGQTVSDRSDSTQNDETGKYIENVLTYLPKNRVLFQFARLFLSSMSLRDLETYSHSELAEFTEDRFSFFKNSLSSRREFQIKHHPSENRAVFEVVMPDASYLTITLESLFRELNLRVFFRLHPLLAIRKDKKGNLSKISEPFDNEDRVVHIYIEFEEIDETMLGTLHSRIEAHFCAIETSHRDNPTILQKLTSFKIPVSQLTGNLPIPKEEWVSLLDWLPPNFSFTGYIAFHALSKDSIKKPKPVPDSGLGVFSLQYLEKDFSALLETLSAHIWRMRDEPSPIVFDTIKVKSSMMRFENLIRLSLKIPNAQGELEEHMFFGLIKRSSLQMKSSEIPVIRYKLNYIFELKNMLEHTYNYNEVLRIFSNIPLFELFRTPAPSLLQMVADLFSINDPHQIHCFIHNDEVRRSVQILVAIPTPLFSLENINTVVDYLEKQISHSDYEVVEIPGVNTSRLHIYFDLLGREPWTAETKILDEEISELISPWDEKVKHALYQQYPGNLSVRLYDRYLPGMPPHYRVRTTPEDAVRDIMFLEQLVQGIQFDLIPFDTPSPMLGKVSLLVIYSQQQIDLFHVMPVLQNMGFYVVDQLNARIGNQEETYGYIQSFRIQDGQRQAIDVENHKTLIIDMLSAIFDEETENDPLNALTILAGLDWRAINVLQLYRNCYLQLGGAYTREKVNSALTAYPKHARLIFEYFAAKFSPSKQFGDQKYREKALLPEKRKAFFESLRSVNEVAEDVILRRLFNLLESSLRTSFYIPRSGKHTSISVKLDSKKVHEMPVPVPYREIYVHDVGMEGLHLRLGPVARGGLRWSDRLDDFRTEILGLVKTQQTKNVVIVPVGSKGGFVIKKQLASREEAAAESQRQYKTFIKALLDITDNMDANGKARHPSHVLPYDELDPYFVVAADKGTATFSDTANAISTQYKFWLDDAFASGGSVGYDHKKEGITARGAWECVKLHFKEKGKNIQTEATTVAGIGDMGGDVFGNGMLLSKAIKLQAAFNHLHIFLDPDPKPESSWQERKRLFALPRSTWKDYNASLISTGGGIYDRKAKEISLSPQVKKLLDVEADILNGEEVIRAILRMKVELLWFGGIGTYLKSSSETDFQVGDTANDAVRISVPECRAQVIGEGANLGLTQLARIEFDRQGSLNTDAIDNSAGVNMSDYEVNIKILLQQMLREKHLKSMKDRNSLLAEATDEVSELVLINNRGQHRLISMDVARSEENFRIFKHLIRFLITEKGLDDQSERIPTRGALEKMEENKESMPRPIMSILQAYVKMSIYNSLLQEGKTLDDPYLESTYENYFPKSIRSRFGKKIRRHPLKREIIGTALTNQIVNHAGCTFFYRMEQLTGKSIAEIMVAYLIFDESLGGANFRGKVFSEKNAPEPAKYKALIVFENILQLLIQSLLQLSSHSPSFKMIGKYKSLLQTLKASFTQAGESLTLWLERGFSKEMAHEISTIGELGIAPDVIYLHEQENIAVPAALHLTIQVNEVFSFQWISQKLQTIELETDWDQSHQDILLKTVSVHKASMIRLLLKHHDQKSLLGLSTEELIAPISTQFAVPLATYFQTLNQLQNGSPINLTTLSVCINRLNFLSIAQ
ncbi:MAG: NAD-glutamate dehydrogenase [SAR324 cluster bacterium]|nr:NAD-glutamate dehydrogenase [SAR324 cluster bacterium]